MPSLDPSLFDRFTLAELEAALVEKRRKRLGELRTQRDRVLEQLRKVEDELREADAPVGEAGTRPAGENRSPRGDDPARERGPEELKAVAKNRAPLGTLVLKTLAASNVPDVSIADLATQLRSIGTSERRIAQVLGRMQRSGFVHAAGDDLWRITPDGARRAADM